MAINASYIVRINPRVSNPATETLEMNGVLLSKNASIPADNIVISFYSAEDVGLYFGFDSEEYRGASVYFLGFENSSLKPNVLYVGRHVSTNVAPFIRGAEIDVDFPTFLAEGNGSLELVVNASTVEIADLDFSAATSFSEIAILLQGAIRVAVADPDLPDNTALEQATVEFSPAFNAFTITGGMAGKDNTMTVTGGNLASRMGFSNPAAQSQGVNARSAAETMAAVTSASGGWVSFTTAFEATVQEAKDFATWSSQQNVTTLYANWTSDSDVADPQDTDNVVVELIDADVSATTTVFAPNCELACFVMGAVGSIDYSGSQTVSTMAFRKAPGVGVTVSDSATATVLDSRNVNYYGDYATRNMRFRNFQTGRMYGSYGFIDPYINAIWLNNALQNTIMQGFERNNRVPYNEDGYTIVRGWVMGPVQQALTNGVIDTGLTLSEAQKAEIIREAKKDIIMDLQQLGFYIQVEDPGAAARAARQSPIVNLWYTYAGSVQKLTMGSIAVL